MKLFAFFLLNGNYFTLSDISHCFSLIMNVFLHRNQNNNTP